MCNVCRSILWNTRMYRSYIVRDRNISRHTEVDRIYHLSSRRHIRICPGHICRAVHSLGYIALKTIDAK